MVEGLLFDISQGDNAMGWKYGKLNVTPLGSSHAVNIFLNTGACGGICNTTIFHHIHHPVNPLTIHPYHLLGFHRGKTIINNQQAI